MTKRISAKYKIDRRLGCNLWGRPKSPYNKRNSRPGQHGSDGQRKKLSDYGNQLLAKQKLKSYYGDITEKQFKKIYIKASNIKGDTSQILIELWLIEVVSLENTDAIFCISGFLLIDKIFY